MYLKFLAQKPERLLDASAELDLALEERFLSLSTEYQYLQPLLPASDYKTPLYGYIFYFLSMDTHQASVYSIFETYEFLSCSTDFKPADLPYLLELIKNCQQLWLKDPGLQKQVAQVMAYRDFIYARREMPEQVLPSNPLPGTGYLDIASGVDLSLTFPSFRTDSTYIATDNSPYATSYLRTSACLNKVTLHCLQSDVRTLRRPPLPLGLIRLKNAYSYIPDLSTKLEAMLSWVEPEGHLVFQIDHNNGLQAHTLYDRGLNILDKLFNKHWSFSYIPGPENGFDSFIFKNNGQGLGQEACIEALARTPDFEELVSVQKYH